MTIAVVRVGMSAPEFVVIVLAAFVVGLIVGTVASWRR